MIQDAYDELDRGRIDLAEELKFTQRLKKYPDEYKGQLVFLQNYLTRTKVI